MSAWEECVKQDKHVTMRLEVPGGHLYLNVITYYDIEGEDLKTSTMCFVPKQNEPSGWKS